MEKIIKTKHPKCKVVSVNHPLDPPEFECGYGTTIGCDECKYFPFTKGRKNPESKCNQPKI